MGEIINIIEAAKETKKLMVHTRIGKTIYWQSKRKYLGIDHNRKLMDNIISGAITGEKANRHLGWAQAAVYAAGAATLDELKNLNARFITKL